MQFYGVLRPFLQQETRDFFQSSVKFENYQVLWNTGLSYSLLTSYNVLGSALGYTLFGKFDTG